MDDNVLIEIRDLLKEIRDNTKKPVKKEKITHIANKINSDIESAYLEYYPRKIGKRKGLEFLANKSWNSERISNLITAIKNYASFCQENETEQKYIKHFSSWVREWEDWIKIDRPKTIAEELAELRSQK